MGQSWHLGLRRGTRQRRLLTPEEVSHDPLTFLVGGLILSTFNALTMTYKAKLTIKFDSEWQRTYGIYDEEMIPEQHLTLECPIEEWSATQIFQTFSNFMMAMGYNELSIMKGACSVAFNPSRSDEQVKKVAYEYDFVPADEFAETVSEYRNVAEQWEQRYNDLKKMFDQKIIDLKAKISRLQNPDNPQYTDEELDAMFHAAEKS